MRKEKEWRQCFTKTGTKVKQNGRCEEKDSPIKDQPSSSPSDTLNYGNGSGKSSNSQDNLKISARLKTHILSALDRY